MERGWTRRWTACSLMAVVAALAVVPLLAASDSAGVRVGWTVVGSQTLSIAGADGPSGRRVASTFVVPDPSPSDLARGHVDRDGALRLTARSNTPWIITARSERATMGTSDDGTYTKPIRDLHVRADGGAYVPLSTEGQIIARGTAGAETVGVDYRVGFDADAHRPGTYRATVIYTISTP